MEHDNIDNPALNIDLSFFIENSSPNTNKYKSELLSSSDQKIDNISNLTSHIQVHHSNPQYYNINTNYHSEEVVLQPLDVQNENKDRKRGVGTWIFNKLKRKRYHF